MTRFPYDEADEFIKKQLDEVQPPLPGQFCPAKSAAPCSVAEWTYETESTHPRMYGQCERCGSFLLVVLPRQRRDRYTPAVDTQREWNRERLRDTYFEYLVDASEGVLKRSGIAQRLHWFLAENPLHLKRNIFLGVWRIAHDQVKQEYAPREQLLGDLTREMHRRLQEVDALNRRLREKLSKRAMRADIRELRRSIEEMRGQVAALRAEARTIHESLAEARAKAHREPLPIPPDYVPPTLNSRAILCNEVSPSEVVYALVDPADPELVRYVGRAADPVFRYRSHCTTGSDAVSVWVAEVVATGRRPTMVLIERCGRDVVEGREAHWIHYYRSRFQADLNRSIPRLLTDEGVA
jgi:hypothetical protein